MLVSVIIPCYNVELYIAECVKSVIHQTYSAIEVICIDNNSTDNTWNILKDLQNKFPQIIIEKELKPGAPAARNKGLMLSKGAWIQFLDADDLLVSNKIEHQLNLLKINNQCEISFIAAASKFSYLSGKETINATIETNPFLAAFINKCGNTCANLWKRKDLITVGLWNENLKSSQETDLMMRLVLNDYQYLVDNEVLTIIRERESGQITHRNPAQKWQQYIEIRLNYISNLKEKKPEAFFKIKGILYDFLMISVITLGKYNKVEADNYYSKFIKKDWQSSYSYGFSKLKVSLVKLFGVKILFRGE